MFGNEYIRVFRNFPNRPCVPACIILEGLRFDPSTSMSYEHICMMSERFKFIHSMQTHGLHVSHHMGKISSCQQRLEMTCISLHKESESKRQQRWTMDKEKRKKPFQSIYVGRSQVQACPQNLCRTTGGKGCVATNIVVSFTIFQISHACLHA